MLHEYDLEHKYNHGTDMTLSICLLNSIFKLFKVFLYRSDIPLPLGLEGVVQSISPLFCYDQ